jgi:4-amino-4-deoxy-L-arabinose transferase-like glycosyltransferase
MSDFYPAFSSTCFVVLTLWLMTVQQRRDEWHNDPDMKRRAFGIGLYFSLPGIMTLISLVDPTSPRLWEWSYTVVALGGAVVMAALYTSGRDRLTTIAYPLATALYLAIGVLAIVGLTRQQAPMENHVDQVLLAVMLFLGVNVAWWLVFAGLPDDGDKKGEDRVLSAGNQAAATD